MIGTILGTVGTIGLKYFGPRALKAVLAGAGSAGITGTQVLSENCDLEGAGQQIGAMVASFLITHGIAYVTGNRSDPRFD